MSSTLDKLETGIKGFDGLTLGGLPRGRTTLVAGTPGSGKTIFAVQFLAEGARRGEPGVYVTFEERPDDIARNVSTLGWDISSWQEQGLWRVVDASFRGEDAGIVVGSFDLDALIGRIEHAIDQVGAVRVAIDSLGAVFSRLGQRHEDLRLQLGQVAERLRRLGVTTVITAERRDDSAGVIDRHQMEEFVADNVVILRHTLDDERRRRTVEVLKFRGSHHQEGQYPFVIVPDQGIRVVPLHTLDLTQPTSDARVTSGIAELDRMCGGGFFRDSVILLSGATGTGKTLVASHFVASEEEGRALYLSFEESREQLFRNAASWGFDFAAREAEGRLRVMSLYPEAMSLQNHALRIDEALEEFQPDRLVVDSLSALERGGSRRTFREFVIGLTSLVKHREVTSLFTNSTPTLGGGTSVTEAHISTLTDSIILLRYVEMYGAMRRAITVLKMRGSTHDRSIREFTVDDKGVHVGRVFTNLSGVLEGRPTATESAMVEQMESRFEPLAFGPDLGDGELPR